MNLEPLRVAMKVEADADAERSRVEAEAAGASRLAGAALEASGIVQRARLEAERTAGREARRRHAAANRRARELRLRAQRSLARELHARARDGVLQLQADPRYPELLQRLAAAARAQLGPDAVLEVDPALVGGVVARAGSLAVDYSLPALAERAIAELESSLEELWR